MRTIGSTLPLVLSAEAPGVLVPLDGDLYLARLGGEVVRLTDTEESELNPALSSTGTHVSFVRDRRLWVGEVGGEARPVTPQEGEAIRWGEAEFVAQEEMGRMTGYWWSPEDRRIAVERFDESVVGVVTRAAIGATGSVGSQMIYAHDRSDFIFASGLVGASTWRMWMRAGMTCVGIAMVREQ